LPTHFLPRKAAAIRNACPFGRAQFGRIGKHLKRSEGALRARRQSPISCLGIGTCSGGHRRPFIDISEFLSFRRPAILSMLIKLISTFRRSTCSPHRAPGRSPRRSHRASDEDDQENHARRRQEDRGAPCEGQSQRRPAPADAVVLGTVPPVAEEAEPRYMLVSPDAAPPIVHVDPPAPSRRLYG